MSYRILRGTYDLVFRKGAISLVVDSVQCTARFCTKLDIAQDLVLDYENASVDIEIRADDGKSDTTGGLVQTHLSQTGIQRYSVLRGRYDVVFKNNTTPSLNETINCMTRDCYLDLPNDFEQSASLPGEYDPDEYDPDEYDPDECDTDECDPDECDCD